MTPDLAVVCSLLAHYAREEKDHSQQQACQVILTFIEQHPDCLLRTCLEGHLTGSAWIVNPARTCALLTHHRKLGKWLQLGGHADGNPDLVAVALQEAKEESGLESVQLVSPGIFDLDYHPIPARKDVPAHLHFDLRFLFEADDRVAWRVSEESIDLAWVPLERISTLNPEPSLVRMVTKTPRERHV
ncbi:MAG TPA: NUDIX hydrolase [Opitutaceae bacterium]|nr:NUDIX hydrolase [Opitutaceae bacterium]